MATAVRPALAAPAVASAALHAAAVAALLLLHPVKAPPPPPIYRVSIIAAPPGPQRVGVVAPPETEPPPKPTAVPTRAEKPVAAMPTPAPAKALRRTRPVAATPTNARPQTVRVPVTNVPRAGGGETGGRGSDVANVHTEGIEFPFPGYLNNIVRQIALNFHPESRNAALRADVAFLIHRDGSVSNVRFVTRSGVYGFDLEAQGALEAAKGGFGPLPEGFRDDVLPVTFSFDPRIVR